MSRNLLPRLRRAPNPANIPQAKIGSWTRIDTPADLAKLEFGGGTDVEVRTRVQSIPSPWARMLLFKNALEDEGHPARTLVGNELLDGLQFIWTMSSLSGIRAEFPLLLLDDIRAEGEMAASERAEDVAEAISELVPRRSIGGRDAPAFKSAVLLLVDGKPVLASSPYTLLFTAEDAGAAVPGEFFRWAQSGNARGLAERPKAFQRYVAQVILPQLEHGGAADDPNVDWGATKRLLKPWLEREIAQCVRQARTAQGRAQLEMPGSAWRSAAEGLHLAPLDQPFGGVTLYRREHGAEATESRWMLRPERSGVTAPPLVLDRPSFDGQLYDGASTVTLPQDLSGYDRGVLPELGIRYPWVDPAADWFTERLLLLETPIERGNVFGLARLSNNYAGTDERLRTPRFALPLRESFFWYFTPESTDRMLRFVVRDTGAVEVSLTLQVGSDDEVQEVTVRRVYDEARIHKGAGPAVALWPSFHDPRWRDYALFRRDSSEEFGHYLELHASRGGESIDAITERRGATTAVMSFGAEPEVIEIRSTVGGSGPSAEPLGVLLPRFRQPTAVTQAEWHIGVDFGTSNTVVSVRAGATPAPVVFSTQRAVLPLTAPDEQLTRAFDSAFFPDEVAPGPFGTAVVHFRRLQTHELEKDAVGVHVNVPFSGYVEPDEANAVAGDLKWSNDPGRFFLTASFLRHVLSVVLAHGLQQGVDPRRMTIAWAYPRAFTPMQVNQLTALWNRVVDAFAASGLQVALLERPIDESRAVLRHFYNDNQVGVVGAADVLLDVGGGTSDIAIYGGGSALALDSVMLGGRNLTGQVEQANTEQQLRNRFVAAFARWANDCQLGQYPVEKRALEKYLSDGQDHLAFSYLMSTKWFRANGQRFSGEQACHRFQGAVLYLFGALFHYVGLSMREIAGRQHNVTALPHSVLVAGNGSRYLHWLTDLVETHGDNVFTQALARILARAAGADASAGLPAISLSKDPKREVALGLVSLVDPQTLQEHAASQTPLIGESVAVSGQSFQTMSRLEAKDIIRPEQVAQLQWTGEMLEIEQYHATLLEQRSVLASHGVHWAATVDRYQSLFAGLNAREIRELTLRRLHYLASKNGGFRGSVFILEVSTVLDRMMDRLFDAEVAPALGGARERGARV